MFSAATIKDISDVAAYRAAQDGKEPLSIWDPERDLRHIPFLGEYTPTGWRRALWSDIPIKPRNVWRDEGEATFMVDASGWGNEHEPALSYREMVAYAREVEGWGSALDVGWAIREQGQFQIVVGIYLKDPDSAGNPAPPEESVRCSECSTVHDDLEECAEADEED